jgi:hypothetical protein
MAEANAARARGDQGSSGSMGPTLSGASSTTAGSVAAISLRPSASPSARLGAAAWAVRTLAGAGRFRAGFAARAFARFGARAALDRGAAARLRGAAFFTGFFTGFFTAFFTAFFAGFFTAFFALVFRFAMRDSFVNGVRRRAAQPSVGMLCESGPNAAPLTRYSKVYT